MSGEMIMALTTFVLGLLLGGFIAALLRKAPDVSHLTETINELQRRLEEWQRSIATQQYLEQVSINLTSALTNAQNTLAQIDRSLQNLTTFTQNNFQPQVNQQFQQALSALEGLRQALTDAQQALSNQAQSSEGRHRELVESLNQALQGLTSLQTLLTEINETLRIGQQQFTNDLKQLQANVSETKEIVRSVDDQVKILKALEHGQQQFSSSLERLQDNVNNQIGILQALQQTAEKVKQNSDKLMEVLIGKRSGQVGEQIVSSQLEYIPQDWLERNVKLKDGEVEFAIKMPNGYLIPIDSKFIQPELVAQLEDNTNVESQRQETLKKKLKEKVQDRAKEIVKYLNDPKVLNFGIAAVPDSVYDLCLDAVRTVAQSHRIVIVKYSLLLPFILSLYLMAQRLGISKLGDTEQILGTAQNALEEAKKALNNMVKEIKSVETQRQNALDGVERALDQLTKLTQGKMALPEAPTETGQQPQLPEE